MNRLLAFSLAVIAVLILAAFVLGGAALGPERALIPAIAQASDGLAGHPIMPALAATLAATALGLSLPSLDTSSKTGKGHAGDEESGDDLDDDDLDSDDLDRDGGGVRRQPLTEAALVVCAGFALLFVLYMTLGVAAGWGDKTLGLLFVAAALECTLAIALGIAASLKRPRAHRLYALGGALSALALAALGGVIVFMQG